jgi:hypothetical protein
MKIRGSLTAKMTAKPADGCGRLWIGNSMAELERRFSDGCRRLPCVFQNRLRARKFQLCQRRSR